MTQTQPYSIERAIRHYPEMELKSVVFEYAICAKCIQSIEQELSTETKQAIAEYFAMNFRSDDRPTWLRMTMDEEKQTEFICSDWIDRCSIKNIDRSELYEYSLYARCIGDRIIPDIAPYMISGLAQDDIIQLFSNRSLGFMDDFTDKYFTGPPELKELFKGRPILV